MDSEESIRGLTGVNWSERQAPADNKTAAAYAAFGRTGEAGASGTDQGSGAGSVEEG